MEVRKSTKIPSSKIVQVRWKAHFKKKREEELKKIDILLHKKGLAGSCSSEALVVIVEHFIKPKKRK